MAKKVLFLALAIIALTEGALASGPKKIAKSNRSLWPYALNSPAEFDFASKMEMLVFAGVFDEYNRASIDTLRKRLGVENLSMTSITAWRANVKRTLLANFNALTDASPHFIIPFSKPQHWEEIPEAAGKLKKNVPENLKAWHANASDFYEGYVYEQMRLAALFPKTTSEILTLDPTEVKGSEYKDKHFLLTFDDGPTVAGGNTDKLIATLVSQHINGIFFVLGDLLEARIKNNSLLKTRALYKDMTLASHGKVHKRHPEYSGWQSSITFTDSLIGRTSATGSIRYFRPPYGQRNEKMISFLRERDTRVMLWNIDSQDWNAAITAHEVADRVTTLMLLWRRGIILFHDINPKANMALPVIWDGLRNAEVEWVDAGKY